MILNRFFAGTIGVGLLLAGVACGDDGPTGPIDPTELDFAPALGVELDQMTKTSSGLYYQDLVVGTGDEAVPGGSVTVHYTGWLHDGTQFDSSVGGDPASFSLGEVIAGWSEGVPGMRVGGTRKLVIPPHLGYGSSGFAGVIPPNATLVFDIELLGVG
jgi:FKBP-type peptidyl-prolyl cis-trans isomerase